MQALRKHPPALDAVEHIVDNYTYGDFIPDDVVLDLLQVDLSIDRKKSESEIRQAFKESQLYQMGATERMKSTILREHNYLLVRGKKGYDIVQPSEQTKIAMGNVQSKMRKVISKGAQELVHIDRDKLDVEQQRENSEAIAKLAQLKKSQNESIGFTHGVAKQIGNT